MLAQALTAERIDQESTITAWMAEARRQGTEDAYAGKRRWPRVTWHVPVTIEVDAGRPKARSLYGMTRDISRGGMGIKVRQRIDEMSRVRVFVGGLSTQVCGRVTHCTDTVGGFLVGIEFLPDEPTPRAWRECA